ncbi:hypothetical protein APHAL10511_008033 [Amanita phalloides]|nr:hypothetical protein APHAL10511_008033 [Amanita phalloides]
MLNHSLVPPRPTYYRSVSTGTFHTRVGGGSVGTGDPTSENFIQLVSSSSNTTHIGRLELELLNTARTTTTTTTPGKSQTGPPAADVQLHQLRLRLAFLEGELERARASQREAERKAERAGRAQVEAERGLAQAVETCVEAARVAEDAVHAQMEAEQRAELAMVEAERARAAQGAAEKTAESALREAEEERRARAEAVRMLRHAGLVVREEEVQGQGEDDQFERAREEGEESPPDALESVGGLPCSSSRPLSGVSGISPAEGAPQPIDDGALEAMRENAARKEYGMTIKHIVSDSTLATCGPGLRVQAISCGFDNGFVEIHNLPLDVDADEIAALFSGTATPFVVTDTRQYGNGTITAMVIVRAARKQIVADHICQKTIRGRALRANVLGAEAAAQHRAPCYELHLSWETPDSGPSSSITNVVKPRVHDQQGFCAELKRQLESSSGLISLQFTGCCPTGTYTEAVARFESWSSAKRAHVQLVEKARAPGFPPMKCDLRPNRLMRYILRVPLDQYHICASEDEESDVNTPQRTVVTESEGMIVQTEYLGSDWFDGWLWSFDPGVKELLEQTLLSKDLGIYAITRDWLSCTLMVHAESQQALDAAAKVIRRAAAQSERAIYVTRINKRLVQSLQENGRLGSLQKTFGGPRVLSLDVTRSHHVLKCSGGSLCTVIDSLVTTDKPQPNEEEEAHCPICLAEVVVPIKLDCGHSYCTSCLRRYLITAPERSRFPITCIGNDDGCQRPIAVPVIRSLLSVSEFHTVLDKAVISYINQHPSEFRHCSTPGCTQLYRSDRDKRALTCPSCAVPICSTCHGKGHPGSTCPEQRALEASEQDRLNSQWASHNGAKKCPSCRVWIQKTAGCNHVHCRMCKAHICWVCLARYRTANDVYEHLREVHGGLNQNANYQLNGVQADFQLARHLQMREVVQQPQTIRMRDIMQRGDVHGRQRDRGEFCVLM